MKPVRIAVIGVGRMGLVHALHAAEISAEADGCSLAALVDIDEDRVRATAELLARIYAVEPRVFFTIDELLESAVSDAAIVATPTHLHRSHTSRLVEADHRILLEKPLTDSLQSDRTLVKELAEKAPEAVMLALQRRFDPPLIRAKELIREGAVGRVFKVISILEDSRPVPSGYSSPGILKDMSVHNIDEVLWLLGELPSAAVSVGSNVFSHGLSSAEEDFDDAAVYMWFPSGRAAQVQVSRNHVSGYHVETTVFGEKGQIHVGHFDQNRYEVLLEAYGRDSVIEKKTFPLRKYDRPLPEFVDRFGPAYRLELLEFVRCCQRYDPFPVDQNDGLRAMEVIDAAARGTLAEDMAVKVGFDAT
jgi:myo-inositol 2-dehydrogenase/D-chiro-inositol 1-dehydrogenase